MYTHIYIGSIFQTIFTWKTDACFLYNFHSCLAFNTTSAHPTSGQTDTRADKHIDTVRIKHHTTRPIGQSPQ